MKATALVVQCHKCHIAFKVNPLDKELPLLKMSLKKLHCPAGGCKGKLRPRPEIKDARLIGGFDLYQAANGLGLPEQRKLCTPKKLAHLLVNEAITGVKLEDAAGGRSIIHSLTLLSGKQIHFASSTKGATVYKVTEAASVSR